MSQENVEVVRRAFQAFADQDLDGALADFTEDVEWRLIGGFADLMGSEFRGPDEVRSFMLELGENLGWGTTAESIRAAGERVVVIVRTAGVGGASGASASWRWGQVYAFRNGRVSAVDNYFEARDALAAAGLRE
jgi:ketosteroid isomerase-like protein